MPQRGNLNLAKSLLCVKGGGSALPRRRDCPIAITVERSVTPQSQFFVSASKAKMPQRGNLNLEKSLLCVKGGGSALPRQRDCPIVIAVERSVTPQSQVFCLSVVHIGNLNPYVIAPVHFALAKRSADQVVLSLRSIACNTVAISTLQKASFVQREVSTQLPEELPYRVIASHRRYNPETKLISSKNRSSFEFRFLIYRFLSTRI